MAALILFSGGLAGSNHAWSYDTKLHQDITFTAAKQFNNCLKELGSTLPRLTPLDVRYLVRSNVLQAKSNVFVNMFRWNYYDRANHESRSWLYVVDTRFHDHFDNLIEQLGSVQEERERLKLVGQLVSYIQDVTSPAHAVPVYTARFWRMSFRDRFDGYNLDQATLEQAVQNGCPRAFAPADNFEEILRETAMETLAAVRTPVEGLPITWEAFWTIADKAKRFGRYGPAGNNFGQPTEFTCGDREYCVLLRHDPLYQQFALKRHAAAVSATMRAMLLWRQQQFPELDQTNSGTVGEIFVN